MKSAKSDTRVTAGAAAAMAADGVGKEWRNPLTGRMRRYLNVDDMGKLIGMRVSYYKSGNCSGCSYINAYGDRVQVAHSRGWSYASKVYVESDGRVYSSWEPEDDCIAELVAMRINEAYGNR